VKKQVAIMAQRLETVKDSGLSIEDIQGFEEEHRKWRVEWAECHAHLLFANIGQLGYTLKDHVDDILENIRKDPDLWDDFFELVNLAQCRAALRVARKDPRLRPLIRRKWWFPYRSHQ